VVKALYQNMEYSCRLGSFTIRIYHNTSTSQ
jgi:hypothetical protein